MIPAKNLNGMYFRVFEAAKRGLDNKEIAEVLGVSLKQLKTWVRKDEELAAMLESTRIPVVRLAEDALLKKAVGFVDVKQTIRYEGGEEVSRVEVRENVHPDTSALKYFLNNRGKGWSDKIQVDQNQEVVIRFDPILEKS